ncbi:MAG: hypothetical protein P8J43_04770 [Pirellulales bacterium]|nr:hypothetical protein [Pirellulales bacterium]
MTRVTAITYYDSWTISGQCAINIIIPLTRMTMNGFHATTLITSYSEIAAYHVDSFPYCAEQIQR